uniref:Phenylalanine--tRNA ligase alpha subunit n=1 Tax=Parascaris univalens TaxID=6257 RepID=A0A915AB76_PARUN
MDVSELLRLDKHFAEFSYVEGYSLSASDFKTHKEVSASAPHLDRYVNVKRWFDHISSFSAVEHDRVWQGGGNPKTQSVCSTMNNETLASNLCGAGDVDMPQILLNRLDSNGPFDTLELSEQLGVDHQKVIGAVKSLLNHEGLILTEDRSLRKIELTKEGNEMAENGSHEANVFRLVGKNGIEQAQLMKHPYGKVGMNKALAAGWIVVDKSSGSLRLLPKVDSIEDFVQKHLKSIANGKECEVPPKLLQEIKKRKLVTEVNVKSYFVKKGRSFTTVISKPKLDLTPEMITSGSWKSKTFKKYNFNALGVMPTGGHLHPLMKVRSEFRQIFFQMGFTEMPTNRYVESSFWNFDALFQPQQHPARDAHDTFFVSDPALSFQFPDDYLQRVKTVHSKGGYGSTGYNYDWKIEEAQKNVLRTHTTAVSARQLFQLAEDGFKPVKMFSIDRVFRNETLDATHLAEFHQVEGVVAERGLSLAHVMGLFTEFFRKCGITNLRFKPTYNPYTEPSMEIFAYHEGLKKWVEIGNSGMFRPEMLLPMGLPPDVNVAGYGLSLERPTMIRYGIDNIRDLFGPKVNLEMIYQNPLCRLDKS